MSPGPAAPAPLSNRTRTSGVWAAKSARAAAASWRLGEADRRQRRLAPRRRRGEAGELSRKAAASATGRGRDLVGHIDVEELQPATDRLRVGRVDMAAVHHVGEDAASSSGRASISAGHCGPVCSSCSAPETKTGTLTWRGPLDHGSAVEERGSGPLPVPGRHQAAARPGWPGSLTGCGAPGWPGRSSVPRWRPARRRSRSRSRAGRRWKLGGRGPLGQRAVAVGGRRSGVGDAGAIQLAANPSL